MRRIKDLSGLRFGKLVVVEFVGLTKARASVFRCKCDCGCEKLVRGDHLQSGAISSCGCIVRKQNGLHSSKLYDVWSGIKRRCYNSDCRNYKNYGGRGITVCELWKNSFLAFYEWAMMNGYKENMSIDRIDNDGPYSPENCRWATAKQQANNRRTSHHVDYCGKEYTIPELSQLFGVEYGIFYTRMYRLGFSIDKYIKKYGIPNLNIG